MRLANVLTKYPDTTLVSEAKTYLYTHIILIYVYMYILYTGRYKVISATCDNVIKTMQFKHHENRLNKLYDERIQ